jgi:aspartate carbamoyltransferase catalytic subunit
MRLSGMVGERGGEGSAAADRRPGRDLCEIADLSVDEACELLASAARLVPVVEGKGPRQLDTLRGALMLSVFNEPSTRTRLSFEVAARRLGAEVVHFVADGASSAVKGETERDGLCNLDAMGFDALIVRDARDGAARMFTEMVRARVINAGDGTYEHPTQALLDTLTILEAFGRAPGPQALAGLRIAVCSGRAAWSRGPAIWRRRSWRRGWGRAPRPTSTRRSRGPTSR